MAFEVVIFNSESHVLVDGDDLVKTVQWAHHLANQDTQEPGTPAPTVQEIHAMYRVAYSGPDRSRRHLTDAEVMSNPERPVVLYVVDRVTMPVGWVRKLG